MTKDTCLPQDPELLEVFKSSPQKILRTTRSLRITHSHARDNTINKKTIHQSIQTGTKTLLNLSTRRDEQKDIKNAKTELERKRYALNKVQRFKHKERTKL
jgi:hypothetical protein